MSRVRSSVGNERSESGNRKREHVSCTQRTTEMMTQMTERKAGRREVSVCDGVLLGTSTFWRKARTTTPCTGSRLPPGHDAQVNGDSVPSTGLPDCSLGKDRAHWMD